MRKFHFLRALALKFAMDLAAFFHIRIHSTGFCRFGRQPIDRLFRKIINSTTVGAFAYIAAMAK